MSFYLFARKYFFWQTYRKADTQYDFHTLPLTLHGEGKINSYFNNFVFAMIIILDVDQMTTSEYLWMKYYNTKPNHIC